MGRHDRHKTGASLAAVGAAATLLLMAGARRAEGREAVGARVGSAADLASSAYQYRADRAPNQNPPEAWILMMQHAGLPFDQAVDVNTPAVKRALCGLLWEEVRRIRRIEFVWPESGRKPAPEEVALTYLDATDDTAHTWWNPRTIKEAGKPTVSPDGRTYSYAIPVDTWGIVASVRGERSASGFVVPQIRAFGPDSWKRLDVEIEWGFDKANAGRAYGGRIEGYDAVLSDVRPLPGDRDTAVAGPTGWRSPAGRSSRRGIRCSVLYIGTSRWRKVWPYSAQPDDVARSIVTVWTTAGSFSFKVSDLEQGPILAPEYGFFVRALGPPRTGRPASNPDDSCAPQKALLADKVGSLPGVPRVRGWATNVVPWFGANPDGESGTSGSLTIPANCVAMHPSPDRDVAVGWTSPLTGRVALTGGVSMGDSAGGNGIAWCIVRDRNGFRAVLASGETATGGAQAVSAGAGGRALAGVEVRRGDEISVVVDAKNGDHNCDTTIVQLTIAESGGKGRTWNLASDVAGSVHAGNPHPDSYSSAGIWRFYSSPAAQQSAPAPSEPPFALASSAKTAREFMAELAVRGLKTIRQRTREHAEPTWQSAVRAMLPNDALPSIPVPPFAPAMQLEVPDPHWVAQWNLGAWHILRHSVQDERGKWHFNDFPFGILSSETYMLLRTLDLQGMYKEAADGLDQWLSLPMEHHITPGQNGHHGLARPDRPLGHFSDGIGCLTHAEGPEGWGGNMDGVHAMGPGAIMFALSEHFRLTGDMAWLRANAPRMKANAEWILRQRRLLRTVLPGGERLWSAGLQPAHVVTPDSMSMHMQFYESEAYYWLSVKRMAQMLAPVDPAEGARMAAEAETYRKDLLAAVERSIALTPVVQVRDGTYHSFIPFAPYVRGFAAGAWGSRRCQGHVGAIYWDTVQSADPLVSPAGLLPATDPRVQGHLDVLEDRLLLENTKVASRTTGFDADRDWFAHASWQYQCGLERHANIHLAADDPPAFLRSWMNQYAVDLMPSEYTFREHTTGGPPDKIFEESCFLERFRQMLVMEDGAALWLARATPREWLAQGKRIAVRSAPTAFGPVSYEIVSDVEHGRITAAIDMPARGTESAVILRLRHPSDRPIKSVTVNGNPWPHPDSDADTIRLTGLTGHVRMEASY